jgi:hypothetical protein
MFLIDCLKAMICTALLPLLAFALMSCAMWYEVPVADRSEHVSASHFMKKAFPVSYEIKPVNPGGNESFWGPVDPWKKLEQQLATNQWFAQTEYRASPVEKGIYFSGRAERVPQSAIAEIFSLVSQLTFFVLPSYSGESGLVLYYDLYIDQDLKKIYRYEIKRRWILGLLLLPLVWINLMTDDLDDAIVATANQFLLDAERDGYFQADEVRPPYSRHQSSEFVRSP